MVAIISDRIPSNLDAANYTCCIKDEIYDLRKLKLPANNKKDDRNT